MKGVSKGGKDSNGIGRRYRHWKVARILIRAFSLSYVVALFVVDILLLGYHMIISGWQTRREIAKCSPPTLVVLFISTPKYANISTLLVNLTRQISTFPLIF